MRFNSKRERLEIRQDARSKKWRAISGLVDRLKEAFYPHYQFYAARNVARRVRTMQTERQAPAFEMVLEQKLLGNPNGLELGKLIDRENTVYTNTRYIVDAETRRRAEESNRHMSLYTRRLIDAKRMWGWTSLFAQFKVFAPELRVGTMIDELCHDEEKRLIVVEHKYGSDGYRKQGNALMNAPLADIVNSPENQHVLQCGVGAMFLERYWNVKVHACVVVYVTDASIQPIPLPEWFYQRKEQIWQHFVAQMEARL